MIDLIHRQKLDIDKYDSCISNSLQKKVYAFSWYLDEVSDHWSVLVWNDYEVVMPLPWKKKWGIQYVYQPFFTQQLGVFSSIEMPEKRLRKFYKSIPRRFVKTYLQVPQSSRFQSSKFTLRDNYELQLNKSYELLRKNFSKGRKSAISFAKRQQVICERATIQDLIQMSKSHYTLNGFDNRAYALLEKLTAILLKKRIGEVRGVYLKNELIGGALFVKSGSYLIYLFSAVNEKGKQNEATSFLLNNIIEKHANTAIRLDFEGSMIPGVAHFFRSFGALNKPYSVYKKNFL